MEAHNKNNNLEKPGAENLSFPDKSHLIYVIIIGIFFLCLTVLFLFFPRSRYSELEKRDLTEFPDFKDYKDKVTDYPAAISQWFSDSQPLRDNFMNLSMIIRDGLKYNNRDENTISFHKTEQVETDETEDDGIEEPTEDLQNPMADENAKMANAGVIVAGVAPTARALMAFGGSGNSGGKFIETLNEYAETFPQCNVYALVASSAGEFYLPDKARKLSHPEGPTLDHIRSGLSPKVKYVNVHDELAKHINEDIFLRTDHHWAPLGAFYAAREFAKTAGVDFKELDSYDKHVVHDFVGSMFGYSKDIAVKKSPEDFVYFKPRNIDYTTTYITYKTNSDYGIISESKPYKSEFFKTFKDGNGGAYNTFIGGDQHLVHVETGKGSRKLLLIKDSFGNAIPGYLFYSFSDIFIVDFRYFNRNMKKFVEENGITDILLTFNIFNACNTSSMRKVKNFLTQGDRIMAPITIKKENADSLKNEEIDEIEKEPGIISEPDATQEITESQPSEQVPAETQTNELTEKSDTIP